MVLKLSVQTYVEYSLGKAEATGSHTQHHCIVATVFRKRDKTNTRTHIEKVEVSANKTNPKSLSIYFLGLTHEPVPENNNLNKMTPRILAQALFHKSRRRRRRRCRLRRRRSPSLSSSSLVRLLSFSMSLLPLALPSSWRRSVLQYWCGFCFVSRLL